MKSLTHPPVLSYGQIRDTTEKVLKDLHPDLYLPIPIEEMVELKLGIQLNTIINLKVNFDIDGFIHTNFQEITLDDDMFNRFEERSRFTIAHELGHKYLHRDIYDKFDIQDKRSYAVFQNSVPEEDQRWLENQANIFAACLLVPAVKLKEEFDKAMDERGSTFVEADYALPRLEGLPLNFKVSQAVIVRRLQKEDLLPTN